MLGLACWAILFAAVWASNCTAPVCNQTTYGEFYFESCMDDAQCTYNFNLFDDGFAFFEYLFNTQYLQPRGLNSTIICCSDLQEFIVIRDLRVLSLCPANHELDEHHGCQLRGDRLADADGEKQSFRFSEFGTILAEVAIVIVILYACFKLLKSIDALTAELRTQKQSREELVQAIMRPMAEELVVRNEPWSERKNE
jgi:hypothetical protein